MICSPPYSLGTRSIPSRASTARSAGIMDAHIKSSVKSGAAAMPINPATRSGRASATRSAIHPPMEEPTTTNLSPAKRSMTHSASCAHPPIVPSSKRPSLAPCPA